MKKFLPLLLLASFFCGCSNQRYATFQVKSTYETNEGKPFYIVLRESDLATFMLEDYKTVSSQSAFSNSDPKHLKRVYMVPGKTKTFSVPVPDGSGVGMYVLYTNPGGAWSYQLSPETSRKVKVLLGKDEILAVNDY